MEKDVIEVDISEEWLKWIKENLLRGNSTEKLAMTMAAKGFEYDLSLKVVREVQYGKKVISRCDTYLYTQTSELLTKKCFIANDRQIFLGIKVEKPLIITFDNLLSADECDTLIALSVNKLGPSTVVDNLTGKRVPDLVRTSSGTSFKIRENEFIAGLDLRIAEVLKFPVENSEGLHILKYLPGEEYKPHYDFFDPVLKGSQEQLKKGGQRIATLIIYLNNVERGGETYFPKIGLNIVPKKGSAVYFEYCDGLENLNRDTLHAGKPVLEGEKWICTKWIRQKKHSP